MGQEIAVYPARFPLWVSLLLPLGVAAFSIYDLTQPDPRFSRIMAGAMLILSLLTAIYRVHVVRHPPRFATFTSEGVIDAGGDLWAWHDIRDIGRNRGTFRIRRRPPNGAEIRLDPSVVGWTKISEVKAFLKTHAPPNLTSKF